jgi:MoaA/NifB/PqqE/SkfB family radical SAM enzyme
LLTRQSCSQIDEAITLAGQLGVRALHVTLMQPTPESAAAGLDLAPEDWRAIAREVSSVALRAGIPVVLDYGGPAPMPRDRCNTLSSRQLYIDARGRVPFCCQLSRYGDGAEQMVGDLTRESLATVVARASLAYDAFHGETQRLHQIGKLDALDDFPCLSCARRHGQTRFLAAFPAHPWAKLAHAS